MFKELQKNMKKENRNYNKETNVTYRTVKSTFSELKNLMDGLRAK